MKNICCQTIHKQQGAHSKSDISVVTMMTMADSPQTSSYCPFGKWMNRKTLISSLNVSTKQLALWVKLQVLNVKAVHRDRLSFNGSPFKSSTFYYVIQEQSNVCLV
jgi:hypothetical protein